MPCNGNEGQMLAMEEWRLLQAVIGRLEDNEIKIRNWFITVLSAFTLAFFIEKVAMPRIAFQLVVAGIAFVFLWLELVQRVPKRKAIDRAHVVERKLRRNGPFDSPKIGQSLKRAQIFTGALQPRELPRVVRRGWYKSRNSTFALMFRSLVRRCCHFLAEHMREFFTAPVIVPYSLIICAILLMSCLDLKGTSRPKVQLTVPYGAPGPPQP